MPQLQLDRYAADVQTRPLEPALARELVLVAPRDRARRPVADEFAAACRRVLTRANEPPLRRRVRRRRASRTR